MTKGSIKNAIVIHLLTAGLFTPTVARAADIPLVRGHVVGETILDYLSTTSGGKQYLSSCQAARDLKTARRLRVDFQDCRRLIAAVNGGAPFETGLNRDYTRKWSDNGEIAFFEKGLLVKMVLRFEWLTDESRKTSYEAILRDSILRFGQPTSSTFVGEQGHGDRWAEWNLPGFYAKLQQTAFDKTRPSNPSMSILTADRYDRETGHAASHVDLLR